MRLSGQLRNVVWMVRMDQVMVLEVSDESWKKSSKDHKYLSLSFSSFAYPLCVTFVAFGFGVVLI